MSLSKLLRRTTAWATAVYFQDRLVLPPSGEPARLFPSKKLLRGPGHVHTRADPFLFAHCGRLYLFIEKQAGEAPGWIDGFVAGDDGRFESLGEILREAFHLSYPFVFAAGEHIYLLPESEAAGEVRLYRFDDFPHAPRLFRTLLTGRYVDPSLVEVDGHWFLFATSARGLELFHTDDIVHGALLPHPASPITSDPRFARCGGVPIRHEGRLLRPAQNGTGLYGGNLSLLEITAISPTAYAERLYQADIFDGSAPWNRQGGHHLSVAPFRSGIAVAVDGQAWDHYVHKIVGVLHRLRRR
jgi:hemin uptake protein HemP